jgi:hypothetical protein
LDPIDVTNEAVEAIRSHIEEPIMVCGFKNIKNELIDKQEFIAFMTKIKIKFRQSKKKDNWYWISFQRFNHFENEFRIKFPDGHFDSLFTPKDDVMDHHPYCIRGN